MGGKFGKSDTHYQILEAAAIVRYFLPKKTTANICNSLKCTLYKVQHTFYIIHHGPTAHVTIEFQSSWLPFTTQWLLAWGKLGDLHNRFKLSFGSSVRFRVVRLNCWNTWFSWNIWATFRNMEDPWKQCLDVWALLRSEYTILWKLQLELIFQKNTFKNVKIQFIFDQITQDIFFWEVKFG